MKIVRILLGLILLIFVNFTGLVYGEITDNESDLIIPTGESYTLDGSHTYTNSIHIDGTLYVTAYDGSGTTGTLELTAPNVIVNGIVNADGRGYRASEGPGAGGTNSQSSSGGGYGGVGCSIIGTDIAIKGGSTYGSVTEPTDLGSGGGGPIGWAGSVGGGAIKINVDGILSIDGVITTNGTGGNAGGSGGSIYITAEEIIGEGLMSAKGEDGRYYGVGGGGGRVAIYYATYNFTGEINSCGGIFSTSGLNGLAGGAGTIYLKQNVEDDGQLIIDNNNMGVEGVTSLPEGSYKFSNVVVKNKGRLEVLEGTEIISPYIKIEDSGEIYQGGGIFIASDHIEVSDGGMLYPKDGFKANNMIVRPGGIVTHSNADPDFELMVAGDLTVEFGGMIIADGKGYQWSAVTANNGPGAGYSSYWDLYGGGASYGGRGGNANPEKYEPSSTYGSVSEPIDMGSAGGGEQRNGHPGGSGGGKLKIKVAGILKVNGYITANGKDGYIEPQYGVSGSGGSGGSIYIITETLAGSGAITADGGACSNGPGGGGGGRIAVYCNSYDFTGSVSAFGGVSSGYQNKHGGAGTIYLKPSNGEGRLVINNSNMEAETTPFPETSHTFSDIIVKNRGRLEVLNGTEVVSTNIKIENRGYLYNYGNITSSNINLEDNSEIYHNGNNFTASGQVEISDSIFYLNNKIEVENMIIYAGGTITHSGPISTVSSAIEDAKFDLVVNGDLTIEVGGFIDVVGKGYAAYTGPGANVNQGGTYGGIGGNYGTGTAGVPYGSVTEPIDLGSGGWNETWAYNTYGTAGGGKIRLKVGGLLNVEGSILANGEPNNSGRSGAGSGGSIYITANEIAGSGLISANGGLAGYGGGGGGRIAVYYQDKTSFLGIITVIGGSGAYYGQDGTIYLKRGSQDSGDTVSIYLPGGGQTSKLQKTGMTLWSQAVPVNVPIETTIATDVGIIDHLGKLYIEGTLKNNLGQDLAKDTTSFYIVDKSLLVSLSTDKEFYKSNEIININGEVRNDGAILLENLSIVLEANGTKIFSDSFNLASNDGHSFSTTTSGQESFTLKGILYRADEQLAETVDYVKVLQPQIDVVITGPDLVGQDYFDFGILLRNVGEVETKIGVKVYRCRGVEEREEKDFGEIILTPGETKYISETCQINEDTVFEVRLSGDVEKTVAKEIKFGCEAVVDLALEPVYAEGVIEIPFVISNNGLVDMELDMEFNLYSDTQTITKSYYVPTEGGIFDNLVFENVEADEHILSYSSQLLSGTVLVRVAKQNVVDILQLKVKSEKLEEQKIPVEVTVKNAGANEFLGGLRLNTGFFEEEKDLSLGIDEEKIFEWNITPNISAGNYEAKAQVLHNGNVISELSQGFTLLPSFVIGEVVSEKWTVTDEGKIIANVGEQGDIKIKVKNNGTAGGMAEVKLSCGDLIDQMQNVWLEINEEKELIFTAGFPDDLEEKEYVGYVIVNSLQSIVHSEEEKQIPIYIKGYKVNVEATLDKDLYSSGDTAHLILTITNVGSLEPTIFTKVNFNDYQTTTEQYEVTNAEPTVLEFDVPVHFTNQKLFYGIYLETNRSLYLNNLYIHRLGDYLSLSTDKQVYNASDDVIITVAPTELGDLELTAPNYTTSLSLAATDQFNLTFTLPEEMVTGTYGIDYQYSLTADTTTIQGTYPIDVAGWTVTILECNLDKSEYYSEDEIKARLKIDSNKDISSCILKGWVKQTGVGVKGELSKEIELIQGEQIIEFTIANSLENKGTGELGYGLYKGEMLLTVGQEAFDVKLPDDEPPGTELRVEGLEFKVDDMTYTNLATQYSLNAVDEGNPPSGLDYTEYKVSSAPVTSPQWTVYTSTITFNTDGIYNLEYRSKDLAGNLEEIKEAIYYVDGTVPVTELKVQGSEFRVEDKTYITSASTITLTAVDLDVNGVASGIKQVFYKIDEDEWKVSLSTYQRINISTISEGIHQIQYYAMDNVGNQEVLQTVTIYVDDTHPETEIAIEEPQYILNEKTYITSVSTITLTAIDPEVNGVSSGMKQVFYKVDEGEWKEIPLSPPLIKGEISGLSEGEHTIQYYAIDNVGNQEISQSLSVYVDNSPPVTELAIEGEQFVINDKTYITSVSTITLTAIDPLVDDVCSGLKQIKYKIDDTNWIVSLSTYQLINLPTMSEGVHTIEYYATDNLANQEIIKTFTVYIDNTPPETELKVQRSEFIVDDKTYITSASTITLTAVDSDINGASSGVKQVFYKIDEDEWKVSLSTYQRINISTISEGIHHIQYYAIDNVGNQEALQSVTLYVDNTPPVSQLTIDGPQVTEGETTYVNAYSTFTFTASDPIVNEVSSGVQKISYKVDEDEWNIFLSTYQLTNLSTLSDGPHTITHFATDNVNNTGIHQTYTAIFDGTKPEVVHTYPVDGSYVRHKDATPIKIVFTEPVFSSNGWENDVVIEETKGRKIPHYSITYDSTTYTVSIDGKLKNHTQYTLTLSDAIKDRVENHLEKYTFSFMTLMNVKEGGTVEDEDTGLTIVVPPNCLPCDGYFEIEVVEIDGPEKKLIYPLRWIFGDKEAYQIIFRDGNGNIVDEETKKAFKVVFNLKKQWKLFSSGKEEIDLEMIKAYQIAGIKAVKVYSCKGVEQEKNNGTELKDLEMTMPKLLAKQEVDIEEEKVTVEATEFGWFGLAGFKAGNNSLEELSSCPNPFAAGKENATIVYDLKEDSDLSIAIYDLMGNLVKTFEFSAGDQYAQAGLNQLPWDGRNGVGEVVANGGYILQAIVGDGDVVRRWKMLVIK